MSNYDYQNPGPGPHGIPPVSNAKKVAAWVVFGALVVFVVGFLGYGLSLAGEDNSVAADQSYSIEDEYFDVLELDKPHGFASDSDALQYGYAVCELLDEKYIHQIAPQLERGQYGILRGVDVDSRAAGLIAAVAVICPEHAQEVYDWVLN